MDDTQFDFSFAPGTTEQQILGFEMAGEIWSQYLTDDVSLSIHVEMLDMPSDAIGGAMPAIVSKKYDKFMKKLKRDILSAEDTVAYDNLLDSKSYSKDINGLTINDDKMMLTRANGKALNLKVGKLYGGLDAYIQMDSNASWSYDFLRNNNPNPNQYDFLSVAMHELGHALGFISGVDSNIYSKSFSLDMFRYSEASFNQGIYDFSFGTEGYFSIDGGQTSIAEFSRGQGSSNNPDGYNYQASHWADTQDMGIMNPIINQGEFVNISTTDLLAMDVIGWDINSEATIDLASLFQQAQANAVMANVADRSSDIEEMKADSDIYYWWPQNNGGGSGWWQKGTSNAPESEPSEAKSSDFPTFYVTVFQHVPPVVQEYILSEDYDFENFENEDIDGTEQLVFNSENIQDIVADNPEVRDWLLSDKLFPEDLVSDLLEGKLEEEFLWTTKIN
ncbi:MAG: NF038122 family metalloprotease [Waterburya sp.]